MRILVFANSAMGLYKFRKELLERLLLKHKLYIALPEGEYVEEMKNMGVIFYPVVMNRRGKNIFQEFTVISKYLWLVRNVKPDLVLTYTVKPNIYGGWICQLFHVPYIANITGLGTAIEAENLFSKILVLCYKWSLKRAACIFFQNKSNRAFFARNGLKVRNIKLLPGSGVNLEEHCYEDYPDSGDETIFLFIGRIMRDKGVVELVEAVKRLQKRYKNIKVQLVGFCEEDFKSTLERINAKKYVELCGQQEDVHSFIKKSHAIVLPSYHEGMANVLLEGAACGRPVLASNVPGCRETFDEGVSGFGFKARSSRDLERVMEKFIELDYEKKVEMGKAGRKKMEKEFSRDIVVKMYEKEIERFEQ